MPLALAEVTCAVAAPIAPVMLERPFNEVLRIDLDNGDRKDAELSEVWVDFSQSTVLKDIARVDVFEAAAETPSKLADLKEKFGSGAIDGKGMCKIKGAFKIPTGRLMLWVSVTLKPTASISGKVNAKAVGVIVDKKPIKIEAEGAEQRVGIVITAPGDVVRTNKRSSKFFRIPAMVRTKSGALVTVFDNRYRHYGDLPADVDVGVRMSKNGGQTWSPLALALDCSKMGRTPASSSGCGDPCLLYDAKNNRVWMAALWSHGNNSIHGSKPGSHEPENCGQYVLAYSNNDGASWSKPINITAQIRDPKWSMIFQGPGSGIVMKNGTLVFPSQIWMGDEQNSKNHGHSNLVYSKDSGKTWKSSTGCCHNSTESQVIELSDGRLLMNNRKDGGGGRAIYVTKDMGETWDVWEGAGMQQNAGTCQGSFIAVESADNVTGKRLVLYSNPMGPKRRNMAIQVSYDEAMTWDDASKIIYDERECCGYSNLAPVDKDHIGVIYEGNEGYQYFLKIPYKEFLKKP